MYISRIVVKNLRCLRSIDIGCAANVNVILGENGTGKSNLLHALRLVLDVNLPSYSRTLSPQDFSSGLMYNKPNQILVGVEIRGFQGEVNETALLMNAQLEPDRARLIYRFRPRKSVREAIAKKSPEEIQLGITDYQWEVCGGGNPEIDLTEIEWDTDAATSSIRFGDLQNFLVFYMPALRDVESDLRHSRTSPLTRLIEAARIPENHIKELVDIVRNANNALASTQTIKDIGAIIGGQYDKIAGDSHALFIELGLSEASMASIMRQLKLMLGDESAEIFEVSTNSLGANNLLYIAILAAWFIQRKESGDTAGELILMEEPEAHLHPQLQSCLMNALRKMSFQTIITTHSPHVSTRCSLAEHVIFVKDSGGVEAANLISDDRLDPKEIDDLERYLDATKSTLFFARRVMLVEGAAEAILIPALVQELYGTDVDSLGISIVPIHGKHFSVYRKLFRQDKIRRKCAIVADGDDQLVIQTGDPEIDSENTEAVSVGKDTEDNEYIKTFYCETTFEKELAACGNLQMLAGACRDFGASKIAARLESLQKTTLDHQLKREAGLLALAAASRAQKGRFAQLCCRHVGHAVDMPEYIKSAIEWLMAE